MVRSTVRFGLMAFLLVAGMLMSAPFAHAITFQLTSDHCTDGCGTPPFGTVDVNQNGANVDIVVTLAAGYSFVNFTRFDNTREPRPGFSKRRRRRRSPRSCITSQIFLEPQNHTN